MTLQQPTLPAPAAAAPAAYAPAPTHAPGAYAAVAQPTTAERYNLFSLVSFLGVFVVPIVGIVFGHIALRQMRRTQEPGRGFALAGLWIGYVAVACGVLFVLLYIGLIFTMMLSLGTMYANLPADYYA